MTKKSGSSGSCDNTKEEDRLGSLIRLSQGEAGIERCKADGDCFYEAVGKALKGRLPEEGLSVGALRAIVAAAVNADTLSALRVYLEAGVDGYGFVRNVASVEDLAAALRRTAKQDKGGIHCRFSLSIRLF